jgi:hypothetical protein
MINGTNVAMQCSRFSLNHSSTRLFASRLDSHHLASLRSRFAPNTQKETRIVAHMAAIYRTPNAFDPQFLR